MDGSRPLSNKSDENYRKFKVCGENDIYNRKVIYARSLKDLIRKGKKVYCSFRRLRKCILLKGKSELLKETQFNQKLRILLFDDDTEVDDEEYFQTLPPNTLFVFSQQSGKGNGIRSRYLQHAFTIELATNLHKVFTRSIY